ncbi:UNVERIFIED_CONTAM: hypothetical protein FKN15_054394 [Acipenser sinensis]
MQSHHLKLNLSKSDLLFFPSSSSSSSSSSDLSISFFQIGQLLDPGKNCQSSPSKELCPRCLAASQGETCADSSDVFLFAAGRGRQPIDIRLSVMAVTRRGLPIESITGAEALVESCGDGEPQKKKRATEQSISSSRGETLGSPVTLSAASCWANGIRRGRNLNCAVSQCHVAPGGSDPPLLACSSKQLPQLALVLQAKPLTAMAPNCGHWSDILAGRLVVLAEE